MPTALAIDDPSRQAACDAIVDRLDIGGGANATVEIRTLAPPATPASGDVGALLATANMSATAFGAASAVGVANANTIAPAVASASGVAGHARFKSKGGVCVFHCSAGEAADTPDMVFNNKNVVAGGNVTITSASFSMPAS